MKDGHNRKNIHLCRILLLTVLLLATPAVCTGCSNVESGVASTATATITHPEPYFPVQKEKPSSYLQALLPGTLEMDEENYLRIRGALVLWPYGYSVKIEDEVVWILDEEAQVVFKLGDEVSIGGGFFPDEYVNEKLEHPLPEGCEGPFWLAGGVRKAD